ncbi:MULTISPECIES: hypothetical protein [unclassified Clostridioides]|uniref:hypothetical protein n=1 Tax=unclassified Clostridioides TaxID=2635829 RepID=UPI001D122A43|nr:hypothetical protein [Clostridioides sp. ES-S-0171-01]MCC0689760.1 hypothetical protein [Clostridioides sp. ES-S-0056-01]MCC0716868.1 hypothetical protein [Clostridioides sp. ES-S-0077-01]UDN54264.1 hypothetical protein JJC02_15505 [Clostridioides sp. ES-S-0054-01]
MKKYIKSMFVLSCIALTLFTGCSQNENNNGSDTDIDKKQLLEVADSNGDVIRQTTDNDIITDYVLNKEIDEWTYAKEIPVNHEKLYTFASYELITEPVFLDETDSNISYSLETLYKSDENFYVEVNSEGETTYNKIPNSAGNYLITFAKHKSDIQDKQKIFSTWGNTTSNSDKNLTTVLGKKILSKLREDEEQNIDKDYEENYTPETINVKKVEIEYLDDSVSITDSKKIADFYNNLKENNWDKVNEPLSEKNKICVIRAYQPNRKSRDKELVVNEEIIIYHSDDEYWAVSKSNSGNDEMKMYYKIPNSIIEYLSDMIKF